jgi:geranylgeranyl pyrophosphate synthase
MAEHTPPTGKTACDGCRVPSSKQERELIYKQARRYLRQHALVPPLSLDQLRRHAAQVIEELHLTPQFQDFATVLMGNAAWESTMAAIPFERRILLLPQCLRSKDQCPAEIDEIGLLCEECGGCPTGELQAMAEELGYVVLVAEGTTVVTKLLETGKVDAVIGVSCLSALERSFPHAAAAAIPGIAIPLVGEGCDRTQVDLDWVSAAIHLRSQQSLPPRLNLDRLKSEVRSWFERDVISVSLDLNGTQTEAIAADWISTGGKRWRPFLAAAVYETLKQDGPAEGTGTGPVKQLAVAVECFHKASLVHDDIEDGDALRYGQATLHSLHGVPIALNIGDLLVGEGYRLLAECDATAEQKARMLATAARGHRELCLGQGEELAWSRKPEPITTARAIEIFRRKTAPAFEVALVLGAVAAGANGEICEVLSRFSDALGIAYQIRDDIEDFQTGASDDDITAMRPSLLLALALDYADDQDREEMESALDQGFWPENGALIRRVVNEAQLEGEAWQMFSHYRSQAIAALQPLRHQRLKSLLFRIVHKVLPDPGKVAARVESETESAEMLTLTKDLVVSSESEESHSGHEL